MGITHYVLWNTYRDAMGEVLKSACGRFCIIQGNDHYSLIFNGRTIRRDPREDVLKLCADDIARHESAIRRNS